MEYGELLERILEAKRLLLENGIEANTVILNSNKYSVFIEPGYIPTVFGMAIEFANMPREHDFVVQYKARKTTNADRIRSMTDEELAQVVRNPCDIVDHYPAGWCKERNCGYKCALEWLKSVCFA